jgi:AhpD family alkylhydroperoxidase
VSRTTSDSPERSRWARYRDRQRGGPPRELEPCGSKGAARRHQRAGEDLCDKCAPVWADHLHACYLRRQGYTAEEIAERLRVRATQRAAVGGS